MNRRWLLTLPLLTPLAFVSAWWLIGAQHEPGDRRYLSYSFQAPDLDHDLERAAGLVSTVLAFAVIALVFRATRESVPPRFTASAVVGFAAAGMAFAYGARIMTAGVVGANIGAGVVFMCGIVAIPLWLGWVIRTMRRLCLAAGVLAPPRHVEST